MKRQIHSLFFSCLTATTFLSYSMEDPNITTSQQDITTTEQAIVQQNGQTYQERAKNVISYLCDDLKLTTRKKLKKYLAAQAAGLLEVLTEDEASLEVFLKDAFDDFLKLVDKDQFMNLALKLQEKYIPGIVSNTIDDIKMNIVILLIVEKAIEYAENAVGDDQDNFLNDERIKGFITWAREILQDLSRSSMQEYLAQSAFIAEDLDEEDVEEDDQILHYQIAKLHAQNNTLKQQVQQTQPRSNGIILTQGIILGWGAYFILNMLSRATCDYLPCVEHFEPDTISGSLFYAFLGTVITPAIYYYIQSARNLKVLLAKSATQSVTKGFQAYQLAQKAKNSLSNQNLKKKIKLNPWQEFFKSLNENQIHLLPNKQMFNRIYKGDKQAIIEFLELYYELKKYRSKKRTTLEGVKQFDDFMQTIDESEEQRILFRNGLEYLREIAKTSNLKKQN